MAQETCNKMVYAREAQDAQDAKLRWHTSGGRLKTLDAGVFFADVERPRHWHKLGDSEQQGFLLGGCSQHGGR